MAVNLRGPFLVCRAIVPLMKKQRYGKIINASSSVIWTGRPWYVHYVSSKAGVLGLARALSKELGEWNICVNAISPGATQTGIPRASVTEEQWAGFVAQQSIKHVERPEDIVGTVVFLASSDSDFITGQVINIDGGLALH